MFNEYGVIDSIKYGFELIVLNNKYPYSLRSAENNAH